MENNKSAPTETRSPWPAITASVAAVMGHLPALGAWWTGDDWLRLAHAAGLETGGPTHWASYWLSEELYWNLMWPMFGLQPHAYAVVRLGLHGLAALFIVRLARRWGSCPAGQLTAGLVFGLTPGAFVPLYAASAGQELLAGVLILAAADLWLAGNRRDMMAASLLAIMSLFSHASGLLGPFILAGLNLATPLRRRPDRTFAWLLLLALAAITAAHAIILPDHTISSLSLRYLACAPLALAIGRLVPTLQGYRYRLPLLGLAIVAAVAISFGGMQWRLERRNEDGLPQDPLVRATALSWQSCQTLQVLRTADATGDLTHLTFFQPRPPASKTAVAEAMGERWTHISDLKAALGGTIGPRVLLGPSVRVNWVSGLTSASSATFVLCESPTGFRLWGRLDNALLYAALTDVGLGHFEQARRDLARAAELGGNQIAFLYDAGQMVIPPDMVANQRQAFTDWTLGLLDTGVSQLEVGGLQDLFYQLLSRTTGRSVNDLTNGSHLITTAHQP